MLPYILVKFVPPNLLGNLILSEVIVFTCSDVFRRPLQMKVGTGQTSDIRKNDAELLNEMSKS
jgi:hypothetical protein